MAKRVVPHTPLAAFVRPQIDTQLSPDYSFSFHDNPSPWVTSEAAADSMPSASKTLVGDVDVAFAFAFAFLAFFFFGSSK